MIESKKEIWEKVFKFNDFEIEFKTLPGNVPIIFVKDIFKYPDEMYEFISHLDFWPTNTNIEGQSARPGLSHKFDPLLFNFLSTEFRKKFSSVFGLHEMKTMCMYTTILSADMELDSNGLCCYPHVDIVDGLDLRPVFAANFNLSQSKDPVVTGFWSWIGKTCFLDLTNVEKNKLQRLPGNYQKNIKWNQLKDLEDLKLESSIEMPYNSMVMYPTFFIHNPIMEEGWFQDTQRVMLSIFPVFNPDDLISFSDNTTKCIWKYFRLDDFWNFYFDKPLD